MLRTTRYLLLLPVISFTCAFGQSGNGDTLKFIRKIEGHLSPKSIGHSGTGIFFAQNMMYRHTINVYNSRFELLKIIKDRVDLSEFGYEEWGEVKGAPVEVTFSHKGKYAWVSQYTMFGEGFDNPGCDACSGSDFDPGFIYKINTSTLKIEEVIKVGSVPKFMAVTPDEKYVLVSNWTSGDVSIISTEKGKEIKKVKVGRHPRGIAVNKKSSRAYIAIMGSSDLAVIDLKTFETSKIEDIGRGPRHLCLAPGDSILYVSINNEGRLLQLNLTNHRKTYLKTGRAPRSMELSEDGKYLYVVNYSSGTISKVFAPEMKLIHTAECGHHPIGITLDESLGHVWVACYSGSIHIYKDEGIGNEREPFLANHGGFMDYIDESEPVVEARESISTKKNQKTEEPDKESTNAGAPENDRKTKSNPGFNETGSYAIIVGAFSVHKNAVNFVAKLKEEGFPAFYQSAPNGMTYAIASSYDSEREAENHLSKIRSEIKSSAWVKKLSH